MDRSVADSHGDHPVAHRVGIAGHDRDHVRDRVLAAWDEFIAIAAGTDLQRPTRLPGWRAHEVCVHLGNWPDHDTFNAVLDSTRDGAHGTRPDADANNAAVTAAHRDDSGAEVLAAMVRNRELVAEYFRTESTTTDLAPGLVPMGRLPFLTIVHGQTFELAAHALDLVTAGAPAPSADLLDTGLAALVDVTGALGSQLDLQARLALLTPEGGWRVQIDPEGWTVAEVVSRDSREPHVLGEADVLIDAAAGRNNPMAKLATGQIRIHRLGGLLHVAPIVQVVPGLPGARSLSIAARTLQGAGGVAHRLLPRR